MKVAIAILAAILGGTHARHAASSLGEEHVETIVVRKYSLVTENGMQVMHKNFDRRRLSGDFEKLSLTFSARNRKFDFKLDRSDHDLFVPGMTVKYTATNGEGYAESEPPAFQYFTSEKDNAALVFVNSTHFEGVLFQ